MNTFKKTSSPFAYHEGEVLFLENPANGYVSEFSALTPLEAILVHCINDMLVASSSLLQRFLAKREGMEVSKEKINAALSFLAKKDYIKKYLFKNPNGSHSAARCYVISKNGQRYLARQGVRARMTGYLANLTPCEIKELLSAIQFTLTQKDFNAARVKMANVIADRRNDVAFSGHIFRTNVLIEAENRTVFVEAVRCDGAIEKIIDKILRMDRTLRNNEFLNCCVSANIELVLVCEDVDHRNFIENTIKHNISICPCFKIFLTDDVTCYTQTEECLMKLDFPTPQKSIFRKILVNLTA